MNMFEGPPTDPEISVGDTITFFSDGEDKKGNPIKAGDQYKVTEAGNSVIKMGKIHGEGEDNIEFLRISLIQELSRGNCYSDNQQF